VLFYREHREGVKGDPAFEEANRSAREVAEYAVVIKMYE